MGDAAADGPVHPRTTMRMLMQALRIRGEWRPVYLAGVAVAAAVSYFAWPATPRSTTERIAFAGAWAIVAGVYAWMAWRSRGLRSPWQTFDTLAAIALGEVAVYEAMWPGTGSIVTPGLLGMVVSGAGFAISLRTTRRHLPPAGPSPTLPAGLELDPEVAELADAPAALFVEADR